jgi:hypothetical protein
MRPENREQLNEQSKLSWEMFLARAGRFAEEGRFIPGMNYDLEPREIRRMIGRLRRHEVPPPRPDVTHEEAAEFLEVALEQVELVRATAGDVRTLRAFERDIAAREAREQARRDAAAFGALKAEAARHGGDAELIRELHRARRAAEGRRRR